MADAVVVMVLADVVDSVRLEALTFIFNSLAQADGEVVRPISPLLLLLSCFVSSLSSISWSNVLNRSEERWRIIDMFVLRVL